YKDIQNLYLENFVNISKRDLNLLKANNIDIGEAELGSQFEALTKLIFQKMGLNVDEDLRKSLNTNKDQIDILIKLNDSDIMIIECKTKKDKKFNTYSSASRQVKAYKSLAEKNNLKVSKTFIVAPNFSEDFINECGLDYELNLSLITSNSLIEIYNAYQDSTLKEFPYKILLRDVLIDSKRVVKSILK
ncbi:restriction endonuclease, partial [Saprospiraceae bacterium]|nr:restriction endonuclease [Saprospiraceae bacterium]